MYLFRNFTLYTKLVKLNLNALHVFVCHLQLFALKESVQDQWSGKTPEDFTGYDLGSLQNILCAYNTTEIAAIHADAYK